MSDKESPTGRTQRSPNLQNIPIRTELGREIREAFGVSPKPDILDKALAVWLKHMTEDELVELSQRLDGEPGHPLLYKLDEHLAKARPDLFVDPNEVEAPMEDL